MINLTKHHVMSANVSGFRIWRTITRTYGGELGTSFSSSSSSTSSRPLQAFAGTVVSLWQTVMLLRLSIFLPLLLVGVAYNVQAQGNQIAGTSLYPEELIPLINRADALLTAGQFNDAAKAYSEALGESMAQLVG